MLKKSIENKQQNFFKKNKKIGCHNEKRETNSDHELYVIKVLFNLIYELILLNFNFFCCLMNDQIG